MNAVWKSIGKISPGGLSQCHTYDVFDHVGITVADLETVTAFFVELDLKVETVRFIHASRQIALTRHGELPGKVSVYC
jgi:hypothetical protein